MNRETTILAFLGKYIDENFKDDYVPPRAVGFFEVGFQAGENYATQSAWISVADRLPENGEMVALYDGFTLVKAEFNAADGEDIVTPFFELHDEDNTFNQICDDCINYRRRIYLNEIPKFLWQLLPEPLKESE